MHESSRVDGFSVIMTFSHVAKVHKCSMVTESLVGSTTHDSNSWPGMTENFPVASIGREFFCVTKWRST